MLLSMVTLFVALMLPVRVALARSYSIEAVDIDATVGTDGSLTVLEERRFDFDGSFHGVYWKIPTGSYGYNGSTVETTITVVGELVNGNLVPFVEDYSENDHTYQLSTYAGGIKVKLYSAHEDESAVFVIGYTDTNVAVRHQDCSELYWKFVSDGWEEESKNVNCTVHLPVPEGTSVIPEENVRAWGHGPLDATVHFEGDDVVYHVPGVGSSEFAEARVLFPENWLKDSASAGDVVKQRILEEEMRWANDANEQRQRARILTYGGMGALSLASIGSIICSVLALIRYRKSQKPTFTDKYFRDVPSDDHPAMLGALYRGDTPEGEDFTATLMRMTDEGVVALEPIKIEEKGLLGRKKESKDFRLSVTPKAQQKLDPIDRSALLTLFEEIGRLAPKHGDEETGTTFYFSDLEKVAKKYPERYHNAFREWESTVQGEMGRRHFFISDRKTSEGLAVAGAAVSLMSGVATFFLMMVTGAWGLGIVTLLLCIAGLVLGVAVIAGIKDFSDEAIELRAKLQALRRWLKDFTRLEEAVPRDVVLWNRLLVMAVSLGVADEVIKQLKVAAPEILADPAIMPTYMWYTDHSMGRAYHSFNDNYSSAHHVSSAALAASEASSGGGGGGGFSGGGGGGFGGGGGGGAF